jgi:hypothetical protein
MKLSFYFTNSPLFLFKVCYNIKLSICKEAIPSRGFGRRFNRLLFLCFLLLWLPCALLVIFTDPVDIDCIRQKVVSCLPAETNDIRIAKNRVPVIL